MDMVFPISQNIDAELAKYLVWKWLLSFVKRQRLFVTAKSETNRGFSMPAMIMLHQKDPAQELNKALGNLDDIELFQNQVLVAVYIRPEKTASGIFLSAQTRDEDRHQSKVGLVVKKGPAAFVDPSNSWFDGIEVNVGDWVFFRPSDGWSITVHKTGEKVLCRILDDVNVRGRIPHPDVVW